MDEALGEGDDCSIVEEDEAVGAPLGEDAMPPGYEAWMDVMRAGPPWWYGWTSWAVSLLSGLCFGLIVMLQWGLWLILTGQIWSPWSMGIGLVIAVAQMLMLFEERKPKESCPVPPRRGDSAP